MQTDYGTVDPNDCPVHGKGVRVMRWVTQPTQGTGKGVRTWTCPQCNAALASRVRTDFSPVLVSGMEGLESLVAAAKVAGVILYDDPRTIKYESLEEGVRVPCRRINESGWVFTAESCHGHVQDVERPIGWGYNPFLRLTTRREHFGHMLALFMRAMSYKEPDHTGFEFGRTLTFSVAHDDRGEPVFTQAILTIPAGSVYSRRIALEAFERFADLANKDLP